MNAQELAQATAKAMYEVDRASIGQGIKLVDIGPGTATMQMTVQEHQTNGHGMCHGGFIFMLADSCFAFACNSHNQRCVAAGAAIEFLLAVQLGEQLTATAREITRSGRTGHYEIAVTRAIAGTADVEIVALFRGRSATIKGQLVQ